MEEENDFILVRGLEPGVVYDVRVIAVDGKNERPSRTEEISMGSIGMQCKFRSAVDEWQVVAFPILFRLFIEPSSFYPSGRL